MLKKMTMRLRGDCDGLLAVKITEEIFCNSLLYRHFNSRILILF